jgi:RNA-directed DNA polymerase
MGAVFALLAAWYFWSPKIEGLTYNDRKGRLHFWGLFIGVNMTFMPMRAACELFSLRFVWWFNIDGYLSNNHFMGIYKIVYMGVYTYKNCIREMYYLLTVDPLNHDVTLNCLKKLLAYSRHSFISGITIIIQELALIRGVGNKNYKVQEKTIHASVMRPLYSWRGRCLSNNLDLLNKINKNYKPHLDSFNRGMVLNRWFSNKCLRSNTLIKNQGEHHYKNNEVGEEELMKLSKKLLSKNIWPMTDKLFNNNVRIYIYNKQRELAINSAKLFEKNLRNRDLTVKESKFNKLLIEAGSNMSSVLWKIVAIELTLLNTGSTTAGVDGKRYQRVRMKVNSKTKALISLKEQRTYLKNMINLSKGKTDQAIRRKGIRNLNDRERKRRELKSTEGKKKVSYMKEILKKIIKEPINYINNEIDNIIEENKKLKFDLLGELKYHKMKNFIPDPIKSVEIPKVNGKIRVLGIPTLKDRSLQMLMKIILEPILEPLGDEHSFGFRPGRGCHQAVCYLANRARWKRRGGSNRLRSKAFGFQYNKEPKFQFFNLYQIINADIKGCFDNIDHEWLVDNFPMPKGYEEILIKLLKAPRMDKNKHTLCNSIKGVPEGGIISPLLMNWTLDGLENHLIKTVEKTRTISNPKYVGTFISQKKVEILEKRNELKDLKGKAKITKLFTRGRLWYVRYADDIIIGFNSIEFKKAVMTAFEDFLIKRGLWLNQEKTEIITWNMGKRFDFLGWTFHLIKPTKVNWIIKEKKSIRGILNDWKGLYVYPSNNSTSRLRKGIKEITSIRQTHKDIGNIVLELSYLIRGWSNYFLGGKQMSLRANIDNYINKRTRMFLWKKYGASKYGFVLSKYRKIEGKWAPLHVKYLSGKKLIVPELHKLNKEIPWIFLEVSNELIKNSFYVNKESYFLRKVLLSKLNKEIHGVLYYKQKGICPICKTLLMNESSTINEDQINRDNRVMIVEVNVEIFDTKLSKGPTFYQKRYDQLGDTLVKGSKWYKGLNVDHIIPIAFGKSIPFKNILDKEYNKQLIHKDCHVRNKTDKDRDIIKVFNIILKNKLKEKGKKSIKECNYMEMNSINSETIIEFFKTKDFKEYYGPLTTKRTWALKELRKLSEQEDKWGNILYFDPKLKKVPIKSQRLEYAKKLLIKKSQKSKR